jgi:hypothetical protein
MYRFNKITLYIFLSLGPITQFNAQTQKRSLHVTMNNFYYGDGIEGFKQGKEKYCLKLIKENAVRAVKCPTLAYVLFTDLDEGKYDLEVHVNNIKRATYYQIEVDTLYNSYFSFSVTDFSYDVNNKLEKDTLTEPYTLKRIPPTFNEKEPYFIINLMSGINFDGGNKAIDDEFRAGMNWGFRTYQSKHFDIPLEFGLNAGSVHISDDTTFFSSKPNNGEHYGYFNCNFNLMNSFHFGYKDSLSAYPACTFQYGVGYNFPFVYNHSGYNDNIRWSHRQITNHNNIYLLTRLMFGKVVRLGVEFEYDLTRFVNSNYPQPYFYRGGIVFKFN